MSGRDAVGVYWGRFNPPHRGHLAVIRKLRRQCRLVVAIGSSESWDTRGDPFSGVDKWLWFVEAHLQAER